MADYLVISEVMAIGGSWMVAGGFDWELAENGDSL